MPATLSSLSLGLPHPRQQSDTLKKLESALKDADYYHRETETLRNRCSEVLSDKSRLEKEVTSMRLFMEEDRKEMQELRRQQQVSEEAYLKR